MGLMGKNTGKLVTNSVFFSVLKVHRRVENFTARGSAIIYLLKHSIGREKIGYLLWRLDYYMTARRLHGNYPFPCVRLTT